MSKEDNIAAQEHLAENVTVGDIDAAVLLSAPDAIDHDAAPGQPTGREWFKTFFTELTAAFPDARLELAHMVADEDDVAVAYALTGFYEGEFQSIAPLGKKIEVRGRQFGRVDNGQIVERRGSSDELGILHQLGVEPTARGGLAKLVGTLGS